MRRIPIFCAAVVTVVLVASVVPGPYAEATRMSAESAPLPFQSAELEPTAARAMIKVCGNCHSNQTVWPWYSHVAPVSWLVRKDVGEGRRFLNFSQWPAYGPVGQSQLLEVAASQIKEGSMPPNRYLLLHPEAKLTDQEREQLIESLRRESSRLMKPTQSNP